MTNLASLIWSVRAIGSQLGIYMIPFWTFNNWMIFNSKDLTISHWIPMFPMDIQLNSILPVASSLAQKTPQTEARSGTLSKTTLEHYLGYTHYIVYISIHPCSTICIYIYMSLFIVCTLKRLWNKRNWPVWNSHINIRIYIQTLRFLVKSPTKGWVAPRNRVCLEHSQFILPLGFKFHLEMEFPLLDTKS